MALLDHYIQRYYLYPQAIVSFEVRDVLNSFQSQYVQAKRNLFLATASLLGSNDYHKVSYSYEAHMNGPRPL